MAASSSAASGSGGGARSEEYKGVSAMSLSGFGRFFPYLREERYPKHLAVNFRHLKLPALQKYVQKYKIPVRADANAEEYACAVAKHFESSLEVDENSTLHRLVNVIRKVNPSVASASVELPSVRVSSRAAAGGGGGAAGLPADGLYGYDDPRLGSKRTRGIYDGHDDMYEDAHPAEGQTGVEMVACEHQQCVKEWFTLASVGLTKETIPDGKWYCPDCRLDPHDYSRGRAIPRSVEEKQRGRGRKGPRRPSAKRKRTR